MPTLSNDWQPRDERDARIEELEAEVERLRAEAEFHGKRAVEFATHIEAALELLESSDPPVYGLVVKALKGEGA